MQLENIKCRNCGAEIDIETAVNGVVQCEYCRSKFTLPNEDITPAALKFLHDGESSLYICRFDDAYSFYKKAAELSPKEPEAYWGMAISQFKVQYVKDEVNDRLQPICHHISTDRISDNSNYKKALSLATAEQRAEYERQADEIDYIREEFYKLKQTGKEYDCFICVKVTDDTTKQRTADYKHADDIYFDLKGKGYNPFFSERELGEVTGADYEARILYALYTSECMIVVCGKEEYLHTKWVKNEYTRFLRLVGDEQKESDSITIAFYGRPVEYLPGKNGKIQGIDLRSLNASEKITKFVEDHTPEARERRAQAEQAKKDRENALLRQIEQKLNDIGSVPADKKNTGGVSVKSLLMRAETFLADKDFSNAEMYFNKVLDADPENGEAWLGLVLVQNKAEKLSGLLSLGDNDIDEVISKKSFQNARKYATGDTVNDIRSFLDKVEERREKRRREEQRIYEAKEAERLAQEAKVKALFEQKEMADKTQVIFEEANKNQKEFERKHSLGGWGVLISFLAAVGFVLACTLTGFLKNAVGDTAVVVFICIIGFIVVLFAVEFLLCLIVDNALQARHKEERDRLKAELQQAKDKFLDEESKYLNMWCDNNQSNNYYIIIDEPINFPSITQKNIVKKYTGYEKQKLSNILSKKPYGTITKAFSREMVIKFMLELIVNEVKASISVTQPK